MKRTMLTAVMTLLIAACMSAQNYLEGDIVYISNVKSSKAMQVYTSTYMPNGLDTITITIKGDKIHEYHSLYGTHVVYDGDSRIIAWGDYTKSGFYVPAISLVPQMYPSLFTQSEKKTILGKNGILFSSQKQIIGTVTETLLFMAETDTPLDPNVSSPLNISAFGPETANMIAVRKIQRTYSVGKMKEMNAANGNYIWTENSVEMIRIAPRSVADEEFDVPVECNMEYYDQIKQAEQTKNAIAQGVIKSIIKDLNKDLKKQKKKVTEKEWEDLVNLSAMLSELQKANLDILREQGLFQEPVYDHDLELLDIEKNWVY